MKALVFGATGQVGTELGRNVPRDATLIRPDRTLADLADPAGCAALVAASGADVVINAAAYTAVDRAEDDEALATLVNGAAPAAMARAAAERGIPFLHVSTDYVFDGSGRRPWTPDAPTRPLGAYGRSKLAGEIGVRGAGGPHAILRTSWVFSAHGGNFVKTMLRLADTRDALRVVEDQVGGPTAAADIAKALWRIAAALSRDGAHSGTYHFAGAPDTSWAGFARAILAGAGRAVTVTGIPTTDYPTPARRPLNSRLDCSLSETVFGISRPDWRTGLAHVLQDLSETST
jgi:dTDP-4-dehydrorhamnose reductase